MIHSNDVTQEMIDALRAEAAEHGDDGLVQACRDANTAVEAFRRVLEALRNAEAARSVSVMLVPVETDTPKEVSHD
jgi:hypothetical protein